MKLTISLQMPNWEQLDTAELSTGNFALLGHREVPAVVDGLNEVMKFNE